MKVLKQAFSSSKSTICKAFVGLSFGVLSVGLLSNPAQAVRAEACSGVQATRIADNYARSIMTDELYGLGFGGDVYASVLGCTYFPAESGYVMRVRVGWTGLGGEHYWGEGLFTIDQNTWDWETKNINGNLWRLWGQLVAAGAVIEVYQNQ
ncbi:MAG: hypothetical protein AAF827_00135 [Cyanobacteria bacterium P01_D01_bin.6]